MAGWLTIAPKGAPGLTPHRFYVVVTPLARKTREGWKPANDEELAQWIVDQGNQAGEAEFQRQIAAGASEEAAVSAAEEIARLAMIRARDSGQYEFSKFDQRALAIVELYVADPGSDLKKRAQPFDRFEVAYDHVFNSGEDERTQAYRAVAERFPGQWEDDL